MDFKDAYLLGMNMQYLRTMEHYGGVFVKGEKWLLSLLKDIRQCLDESKVATDVSKDISNWMSKLEKKYPKEKMMLDEKDMSDIDQIVEGWDDRVREELEKIHSLKIDLQSGLNPDELRKVADKLPSELISLEIWERLTEIEKSDFSDAARCLLLGTATPSVMVALRGAEASIRNYYRSKTKNEPGGRTWRQLTKELKDNATELSIKDTFIGYLDYIGDAKRNFAQHPNKIYTLREAVMIFMQVAALIEDIYLQI